MNENEVLSAIAELTQAVNGMRSDLGTRLDNIEKRLGCTEQNQRKQTRTINEQQRDINWLIAKVEALCDEKPIWKSRDGREVGLRPADVYALSREAGLSPRRGLRALDGENRLVRDGDGIHLTKTVRIKEKGPTRSVVILLEENT